MVPVMFGWRGDARTIDDWTAFPLPAVEKEREAAVAAALATAAKYEAADRDAPPTEYTSSYSSWRSRSSTPLPAGSEVRLAHLLYLESI